jgi:hypothetical protein
MSEPTASGSTRVVVATHGHCFDGMCSAALFTRLLRHVFPNQAFAFTYHGMGYGPGSSGVDPKLLDGDVNAILDFRFSTSPKLTWYFDHHVSAFPSADDKATYEARAAVSDGERRVFHDGAYGSCTKLITDVGAARFGLNPAPLADLVRWADMIDTASFPSAKMAVDRTEPVLQLMTVVEHMGDDAFLAKMVPRLLEEPITDVARGDDVANAFAPLYEGHKAFVELVRAHAVRSGNVVLVDLTDTELEVAGKFVTYALYPDAAYSVLVSRGKGKLKISIGFNPWCNQTRTHNIAKICERHGGGGHPVVGAISLAVDKVDDAKKLAREIATELST